RRGDGLVVVLRLAAAFGDRRVDRRSHRQAARQGPTRGPARRAAGGTPRRFLLSTAFGTLWTLPAGLAIGLSPRLSRIFQPVVQVAASFPAPRLCARVIAVP